MIRDKVKRLRRMLFGVAAALIAAGLLAWAYAAEPEQPAHQGLKDRYGATAHLGR